MFRLLCLFLLITPLAFSATPKLSEILLAEDIESGIPVNPAKDFSHQLGAVFLMTRVEGYVEENSSKLIYHHWKYKQNGKFISVAKVPLEIKSKSWRTWSRKRVTSNGIGDWKVEILDSDGKILKTVPFRVTN